jgi:replicative DNA helicase
MSYELEESPFQPGDIGPSLWTPLGAHDLSQADTAVAVAPVVAGGEQVVEDTSAAKHVSSARTRIIEELKLRAEFGDAAVGGEELGYVEVDSELIVEAGRLVVLGAREGVGKTAWALQTARYVATRLNPLTGSGGSVVYYITEMSVQQTVERVVVSFAQLQMRQLKKNVTADVVAAVEKAFDILEHSGLHIVNAAGWTADQIVCDAHAFKRTNPDLRAVFVDNLTGIAAAGNMRSRNQWEQIGDTVQKLNMLSMADKGVAAPVMLLAHLKRPDRLAASKEPSATDFAGSDAINRWASVLVLLHERSAEEREAAALSPRLSSGFGGTRSAAHTLVMGGDPFADDTWTDSHGENWERSEIGNPDGGCSHTFIVVKNRDGRRFRADLNFIGAQMRFTDARGRSLRPYEMPDPEPVARSEFRRKMLELGDL